MLLLKVVFFLLVILAIVVDSRPHRKRRQTSLSSAYYGTYGISNGVPGAGYPLDGFGFSGYPIGNNWYITNNPAFPYNAQLPYNVPQYSNPLNNDYSSWDANIINDQSANLNTGQSFMPSSNEWLPLPGRDRRRRYIRNVRILTRNNKLTLSKDN